MSAVSVRLEVPALKTLLTGLGALMSLTSRRVDRFRRQVARDLLIEIRSLDGARQLWFYGLTRIVAPIGRSPRPRPPAPVPIRSPGRAA